MELASGGLRLASNLQKYFQLLNINGQTICPKQSHSSKAVKIEKADNNSVNADAVITDKPGLILTVTVADCFPVYFFDPGKNIIALAHCGWRGTVGELAVKTLTEMGSKPTDVSVGIGPGIQACHFEIQPDILSDFKKYPEAILTSFTAVNGVSNRNPKIFIGLPKIITEQLKKIGVKSKNIESCGECTFHRAEKYFSYRRDHPKYVNAMIAYLVLPKP